MPKLDQFQNSDKQQVIELLMQNDNVLLYLYEKLFPLTTIQTNQIKIQPTNSHAQIMKATS